MLIDLRLANGNCTCRGILQLPQRDVDLMEDSLLKLATLPSPTPPFLPLLLILTTTKCRSVLEYQFFLLKACITPLLLSLYV